MKLIEMIRKSDIDEVWLAMRRVYELPNEGKKVYQSVLNELKNITIEDSANTENDTMTIGVCMFEDVLEPGNFVLDVFGISQGDENRYSLNLEPWSNWVTYEVLDKSIEIYGEAAVLAHILYEMTFYGCRSEEVEKKHQEVIDALNESYQIIEDGKAEFIPAEEVYAKLGLEKAEPEDPEEERKKSEETKAAINRNEAIYQELISDWLKERDQ